MVKETFKTTDLLVKSVILKKKFNRSMISLESWIALQESEPSKSGNKNQKLKKHPHPLLRIRVRLPGDHPPGPPPGGSPLQDPSSQSVG